MKLSVIIPVFNVVDYLRETLDCIVGQTYTDWELILVDDGSTDGSLDVAKEYCAKDSRISLFQRDTLPKGAPNCRNIGLSKAKGKYVIYLDSDDIIAPYCFKQRVDYVEENECDFAVFPLVGFYNKFFDADGMVFGYKPEGDAVSALLARTLPFVVVSNIYKREALVNSVVKWDTELKSYQDSDYNLQAIKAGLTYKVSNLLPDYFYRLSAQNSICKKLGKASNCLSQIGFLEKQWRIYGDNKQYRKALDICAAQVLQNIFCCEDPKTTVAKFLGLKQFEGRWILKNNIRMARAIHSLWSNETVLSVVQIILIPVFFLRFKKCFRNWNNRNVLLYRELEQKYKLV